MKAADKFKTAGLVFLIAGVLGIYFSVKLVETLIMVGIICFGLGVFIEYVNSQIKLKEKETNGIVKGRSKGL